MPVKEIVQKLRLAGHKVTPQRITIIKSFMESAETSDPSCSF